MLRTTLFLISWILFLPFLSAQFVPEPIASPSENKGSFLDLQTQYHQWAFENDLNQQKGWKWYARWAHEVESRLNGDGSIASPEIYFQESMNVTRMKQAGIASRQANWEPVGPDQESYRIERDFAFGIGRVNTVAFHPSDSNIFWVGAAQGGVWKTSDYGKSWIPLTDALPILRISDITVDAKHPDTMYISTGDYAYLGTMFNMEDRNINPYYGIGIYKTIDGGNNWFPTGLTFQQAQREGSLANELFIDSNDSEELLVAGIFGIKKSYDGGSTWTTKVDSVIWDIKQDPSNPQVLYASSAYIHNIQNGNAAILKSTDFGENWFALSTNIPPREVQRIELAISPSDSNYLYAIACDLIGGFYGLYKSINGGQSWSKKSYYPGNSKNILHWYDGNNISGGQGTYDLTLLVDPNDKERIYAGGINLWGSKDGGTKWYGVSSFLSTIANGGEHTLHADQHTLVFRELDQRFYLCNDGGIFRTDSIHIVVNSPWSVANKWPTKWENITNGLQIGAVNRLGVWTARGSNGFVAGIQDVGTSFTVKSMSLNPPWIQATSGDGMCCFHLFNHPYNMCTSTVYGDLYRSRESAYWFEHLGNNPFLGKGDWITPFMKYSNSPEGLIAAYGQVAISENLGDTWPEKISNFPPMQNFNFAAPTSALAIAQSDSQTIYLAKRLYHSFNQPTEFYRTTDKGENWQNITSGLPDSLFISYISIHNTNPQKLWLTVKGFTPYVKVFYSENGGNTWQNISKNLPNVSANCIIHQQGDSNNTVYVGTDVGVFFHNDTSNQWIPYYDKLPNIIISDLKISLATNKIFAATHGRGIWMSDLAIPATSIEKELNAIPLRLFPNPNSGRFKLEIGGNNFDELNLEIIDLTGKMIYQKKVHPIGNKTLEELSFQLPSGLYFLKISNSKSQRVLRFLVN